MSVDLDPLLTPLAAPIIDLVTCVCNELQTTGAGPVCWCGLWPGGLVSWEYCSDCGNDACGMAWVRVAGANPYEVFPTVAIDDRCTLPIAVTIELGALRCLPQPADGEILSETAMAEVTLGQLADMWALRRSVICCRADFGLGVYTPVGPAGGCIGGVWTAYVGLD